jgi:hypothetical protein
VVFVVVVIEKSDIIIYVGGAFASQTFRGTYAVLQASHISYYYLIWVKNDN